ncbi:MAG: glycosyltransferase family 1 protein [Planctomycetota bacterium]|nr:MAG: glycosyltransferase family 1 protein [Planctomycetota bacterium]
MKVGFDIRPALFGGAGVGRYARELAAALTRLPDGPFLELYGAAWRHGELPPGTLAAGRHRLHRGPLPARAWRWIHRLPGCDAARLPARVALFHWTDYVYPPVRSAPRVLTLHDAAFALDPAFHGRNTPVLMARVQAALQHADRVIVVSEPARADAEFLGVSTPRIRVVANGVSPFFQPPLQPPARPDYLLSVGTLEPRKNYPRLLQALEQLWDRDEGPDWVLVGHRGWECADFEARLASSRHRARVRWLAAAGDDELLRLYQQAAALLYPSLHEGFGLPVLEAMACATPVLVAAASAPAWVAGPAAVTVDPRDPAAIADGIRRVLAAPRAGLAAALAARAAQFTWERAARETCHIYRELAL